MSAAREIDRTCRIGFIGLGWMGSNFANRLVDAGWQLRVYDIDPERKSAISGAEGADTAAELVETCDVVLMSLPNSEVFESVMEAQVLPGADGGMIVVDLGTSRVGPTRRFAAEMDSLGAALLDAPVSGDPRKPVYMFVGGKREAFDRVRALLETLADPAHLTVGGDRKSTRLNSSHYS